jgi:curved DNA-binding protein
MGIGFKDYYKILGVDPSADAAAIKSAYRRLALKYHPDVARSKSQGKRFLPIQEAYEVLADPDKRGRYDELRRARPLSPGWSAPPRRRPPVPGRPGFSAFFHLIVGGLGVSIGFGAGRAAAGRPARDDRPPPAGSRPRAKRSSRRRPDPGQRS